MCTREVREAAYKAIVRPQLEYASSAWSPHTYKNIDKLEGVQKRAARFVLGNYNYGPCNSITTDITHILKWPSLHHRRIAHDIHLMYRIINRQVNIQLPSHLYTLIHTQVLHSDAFKYSYFVRTPRIWNRLPPNFCNITSFQTFKKQSTHFITSKQIVKNNTWTI